MARVRFTEKFKYSIPSTASVIVYQAGWEGVVKRDCAEKAKAAGKAVELKPRGKLSDGIKTRFG